MIITNVDVIAFVCTWLMAHVAHSVVSFEDDVPAGVPVGGESVFARFGFVGPAVTLMVRASAHVCGVVGAVGLETRCWCEWHWWPL